MGLDTVELVIEVEEEFNIKIGDRDAEKILTVGQLHDYIVERLPPNSPWNVTPAGQLTATEPCLTAAAFYRLRRAFAEVSGHARCAIRPTTPIHERIPAWGRRKLWKHARQKLGLKLPCLGYSTRTQLVLAAISGIAAVCSALLFASDTQAFWTWLVCGFCGAFVLLLVALRPLACEIEHARTFGDVARWIVVCDHNALCAAVGVRTSLSVWCRLVAVVSEQLGVDPTIIRPESSFVNDLGAG